MILILKPQTVLVGFLEEEKEETLMASCSTAIERETLQGFSSEMRPP
jgi:hypothetical protein